MKSRMGRRGKGIANILMIFNIVVMGAVAGLLANHHSNEQKKEKLEEEIEQRRTEEDIRNENKEKMNRVMGNTRGIIRSLIQELENVPQQQQIPEQTNHCDCPPSTASIYSWGFISWAAAVSART